MTTIRHIVSILCPSCWGTRLIWKNGKKVTCSTCNGTGEIDKVVNEVQPDSVRGE